MQLKTEGLKPGRTREFDSYDPLGGAAEGNFVGDGRAGKSDAEQPPGVAHRWLAADGRQFHWNSVAIRGQCSRCGTNGSHSGSGSWRQALVYCEQSSGPRPRIRRSSTLRIAYADGEIHRASEEFSSDRGLFPKLESTQVKVTVLSEQNRTAIALEKDLSVCRPRAYREPGDCGQNCKAFSPALTSDPRSCGDDCLCRPNLFLHGISN